MQMYFMYMENVDFLYYGIQIYHYVYMINDFNLFHNITDFLCASSSVYIHYFDTDLPCTYTNSPDCRLWRRSHQQCICQLLVNASTELLLSLAFSLQILEQPDTKKMFTSINFN